ncbi:hypothetical protein HRF69_16940 [Bacillus circulans]|uniref:hypothetical protein n=1 Tax=Niallia circulans TaxID=1397 RepID=UPI00155FA8FC|nr:hypothetical protein [Niallia circulans]NRG28803.1 hypothetical protein [Niallia circulans]
MRDTEPYKTGYDEGFAKGFNKAVELANAVELNGEQRLLLAMESLNYLPFPKIIKLFSLSVNQAEKTG